MQKDAKDKIVMDVCLLSNVKPSHRNSLTFFFSNIQQDSYLTMQIICHIHEKFLSSLDSMQINQ